MKLTVLGNCGPFPPAGGACSGYLLSTDEGKLLLDCGTGCLAGLNVHGGAAALTGAVLSHLHFDHFSDLLPMSYARQFAGCGPLPLLLPRTPPQHVALLTDTGAYEPEAIQTQKTFRAAGAEITFFPVKHPVECYAVRVEQNGRVFVYTGDTNECEGLADFARGADVLLADACFAEAQWTAAKPHFSAPRAARMAEQAGVKKLLLTHFTPGSDRSALLREARQAWPQGDIHLAEMGDTYPI
ncbi:MAG: MBL fold metallo-hydrolase [Eubacteriales bacterium]|nr:MBL fold metallo-hydrolase [Eubacteriales bacterium]